MNRAILPAIVSGALMLSFCGCHGSNNQTDKPDKTTPQSTSQKSSQTNNTGIAGLAGNEVMTAERQASISPQYVLQRLKDGNKRFVDNSLTQRDHTTQLRKSTKAQFPKAIILGCVDSRVPVEDVFDLGLGDVFVARVAGNFTNTDILGSMEYACKVAGSKLVMVLGHEHCGAVKSAIDGAQLGNITAMLSKLAPALEQTADFKGEKSSKNPAYVHAVCENNVRLTIDQIRKRSEILKQMEDNRQILIVGGIYDLDTGAVTFLD